MVQFQLFRVKVYLPKQGRLFEDSSSSNILRRVVLSRPSAELRRGTTWHIGNIHEVGETGIYFALGRTTRQTLELWDEQTGDFAEAVFEHAPYTHVVMDTELQICAITSKAALSRRKGGIAHQLRRLLDHAPEETRSRATFDVSPILDPKDFLGWLREAYVIERFGMAFSRPNPFDANEDFQKPLEKTLREMNGERGKVVLHGDELDKKVVEELTRSAAATGSEVDATAREREGGSPIRRQLKGQIVTYQEEDLADLEGKARALRTAREIYHRIRDETE